MKNINKFLAAASLSAAVLLPNMVQAMEIQQFDKMVEQDQNEYVADLIIGAQKVLIDEGRSDLAAQVHNLFTQIHPGDKISAGMDEFERNLAILRLDDAKKSCCAS